MNKVLYYPKFKNRLIYPEAGDTSHRAPSLIQWPPRTVIFHSAVGSGSLYNYFNNPDQNLESHSWIDEDGSGENYLQADRRADANLDANAFAYSVETADNGDPDNFPWTDAQCNTIVDMMVWGHREWEIPLKRCPEWDKPGMGYHTMFGAPSHWTPVAKSCPGKARKAQFDELLARAQQIVAAGDVEDMAAYDTFIAWYNNTAYWCEPGGKRQLSADNARFLKDRTGIPDLGSVAASFLNELPTYDEAGTAGGSTVSQLIAADDDLASPNVIRNNP